MLFLYGNHGGDVFNFDLAVDLFELDVDRDAHRARLRRRTSSTQECASIAEASRAFFAWQSRARPPLGTCLTRSLAAAQASTTRPMGVGLTPDPHRGPHPSSCPTRWKWHRHPRRTLAFTADLWEPPTRRIGSSTPSSPTWVCARDTASPSSSTAWEHALEELYLLYRRTHAALTLDLGSLHRATLASASM